MERKLDVRGVRFELNERGIDQLVAQSTRHGPRVRDRSTGGEIVGESHDKRCWTVKWDNRKTPCALSKTYVRVIDPAGVLA